LSQCADDSPFSITAVIKPPSNLGKSDGEIDISINFSGGLLNLDFKITWYDGQGNILLSQTNVSDLDLIDIPTGTYTVKVEHALGCVVATFNVYDCNQTNIIPKAAITDSTNPIANDGSITLSLAAGSNSNITYTWIGTKTGFSSSTKDIFNLAPDEYCVIIEDPACGLIHKECFTVGYRCEVINIGINYEVNCFAGGGTSNYLILDVSNGTPPYQYKWSDGNTEYYLYLQNGVNTNKNYIVTVTDSKNCKAIKTFFVPEIKPLTIKSEKIIQPDCGSLGSIEIEVEGGNGNYTYFWSNKQPFLNSSYNGNLPEGKYTVSVSSGTCSIVKTYELIDKTKITIEKPECIVSAKDAIVKAKYFGNSTCSDCEYIWNNGEKGPVHSVGVGIYSVTVTNPAGCSAVQVYNTMVQIIQGDCSQPNFPTGNGTILSVLPKGFSVSWKNPISYSLAYSDLIRGHSQMEYVPQPKHLLYQFLLPRRCKVL
jgi:hypothetical protein